MPGDRTIARTAPQSPSKGIPARDPERVNRLRRKVSDLDDEPIQAKRSSRSINWQIPIIAVIAVLAALGLSVIVSLPQGIDFEEELIQADHLISIGYVEEAREKLRTTIEPNLEQMTLQDRGRFFATSATLLFLAQSDASNSGEVAEHYQKAMEFGQSLSQDQLENWADAAYRSGQLDDSFRYLLDWMNGENQQHTGKTLAQQAERAFLALIEYSLRLPDLPVDALSTALADYQTEFINDSERHSWAVIQLANLQLESGNINNAIEYINNALASSKHAVVNIDSDAELKLLLARAHFQLGDYVRSKSLVEQILTVADEKSSARSNGLVLQGEIELVHGNLHAAEELLNSVLQENRDIHAYLPALFARAETYSKLGEHELSFADYKKLTELLPDALPRRDVTSQLITESLCNRHDAALSLRKLNNALRYVSIAKQLFDVRDIPGEVLVRLASTNRQQADNLLAMSSVNTTDPAIVQASTQIQFELAGEYYLRYSNALKQSSPDSDAWHSPLWNAAECFDRAGDQKNAIALYQEYMKNNTEHDSRYVESLFRIGQAHHALGEYDDAIEAYENLRFDFGRSAFAAQSYVALATCYEAIGNTDKAIETLESVVRGESVINPDSPLYQEASLALGMLHYTQGSHFKARSMLLRAVHEHLNEFQNTLARYLFGRAQQAINSDLGSAYVAFDQICNIYRYKSLNNAHNFESEIVKHAHLYRADVAYLNGELNKAIRDYEDAARICAGEESSLYALLKIAQCYETLGNHEMALAALERGRSVLVTISDQSFYKANSLTTRESLNRWIEEATKRFVLSKNGLRTMNGHDRVARVIE